MQDKTSSEELIWEVKGPVGIVTFNRPQAHNALTFSMYDRLGEICATAPADGTLRAIIITGAGGRAFGAGTDISLFRDFKPGPADGVAYEARMERMFEKVESLPGAHHRRHPRHLHRRRRRHRGRLRPAARHPQPQVRLPHRPHARQLLSRQPTSPASPC